MQKIGKIDVCKFFCKRFVSLLMPMLTTYLPNTFFVFFSFSSYVRHVPGSNLWVFLLPIGDASFGGSFGL